MEEKVQSKMLYDSAKKRVEEVRNYFIFVLVYLGAVAFLKFSHYPETWLHFKKVYIDFWIVLQGIFFALYGLYLFLPYSRRWEKRKIEELMTKETENKSQL